MSDHVATCTGHSGAKKAHDWAVEQMLFSDKRKGKTQHVAWKERKDTTGSYGKKHQVTRSQGLRCGDIELVAYLNDAVGPVNLILELCIAHERRE